MKTSDQISNYFSVSPGPQKKGGSADEIVPPLSDACRVPGSRWLRVAIGVLAGVLGGFICENAGAQGTLTNGWTHAGIIAPVGDSDSWTFSANTGDRMVIRVGEIAQTNNFTPRIRLQNPGAVQIGLASSSLVAEIAVTATNAGTYTVIVDDAVGTTASGTYRLTLAKSAGEVFVGPGDEGGPMTNGVMHTGTVLMGDLDVWTFAASDGDNLVVRIGELTDTNLFYPGMRLYGPNGVLLRSSANLGGGLATEVSMRATNSGTFFLVVGDNNGGIYGSGDYRLTLAKTGDAVVIASGDNGGPLTNAVMHTGTVLTGDLDLWSFTATAGDNLALRIGAITDTNTFFPGIRLYGPDGALLDSGSGDLVGEVSVRATNSGTFVAIVGDANGGLYGSGDYRLTLARTGDAVEVSSGDEGGAMTNGVMHKGTVLTGDLDLWTFTANNGDNLLVRIGMISDTNIFYPGLRLFGPDGVLLRSSVGDLAAEVSMRATNSGTFLVLVGDGNGGLYGSGDYRLTLASTGDPVVVSGGDDGGPLTNGFMHTGTLLTGDLDLWTFTANNGDNLLVRMGMITDTNTFYPGVRLYGPDGALLRSSVDDLAAEVSTRATNSGTFLVVAGDGNGGLYGSGDYRLTLAKTGAGLEVTPGDEGGYLIAGTNPEGTIPVGDLDVYAFTICRGENVHLQLDELSDGGLFFPGLRLYGPDGALIRSSSAATTALINLTTTNAGTFTVIVGDNNGGLYGSGTYRLTGNGLSAGLKLCLPTFSGTNAHMAGIGGVSNATFILFTQTNVATPLSSWTPILTNQFDQYGVFSQTNVSGRFEAQRYFNLQQQ